MKSSKFWKIIWLIGIYANLFIILYLVVIYKVEWEYKDLNTYLYFYDCGHELCTSNVPVNDYYNKIVCEDDVCPYVDTIINNNLILRDKNKSWIYNYITDKVINDTYIDYRYMNNNMFVVMDENRQYGIIDIDGNLLLDLKYNYIDDYKYGIISYKENDLYGIVSNDDKYNISPKYEDVVLINEKNFAARENNVYQLYSYNTGNVNSSVKYNFVYAYNDVILVITDSKIDILNSNLQSSLLMKIDTYYKYLTGQERDSLDIYSDGEYIYFKVFVSETEYNKYKYSIKEKKLINN